MQQFRETYGPDQVGMITYQCQGWEEIAGGWDRFYHYGSVGTPTVAGDCLVDIWPCEYSDLVDHFNERKSVPSPLEMWVTEDDYGVFTVHMSAEEPILDAKLMMVAYERVEHEDKTYYHWARAFLNGIYGEDISLSAGEYREVTHSFVPEPDWVYENMGVVAWLQRGERGDGGRLPWRPHEGYQSADSAATSPATPTVGPSPTAPATSTPGPSATPTATGTVAPTATSTPAPTDTPVEATATPEPTMVVTATPSPAPTAPCAALGVELWMPAHQFHPGMECRLTATICNPDAQSYGSIPLFVVLDVFGSYWWGPGWSVELDHWTIDLAPGSMELEIIPAFTWPGVSGSASGLKFHAAMTDPSMTALFGELSTWEFGYGP